MAKRRKPWERLFDTVKVDRDPKHVYVPPATDAELDSLEMQLGSRLPHTYREFMKRFGPGELKGWVRLNRVTDYKKALGWSLLDMTRSSRQFAIEGANYPNGQWLSSLVYFASSGGGDQYAWDPATITASRPHECQFYYLRRLHERNPVPAGDSFWRFIAWADEDIDSWTDIPDEEREGLHYRQHYLRAKKRPPKQDVKAWLVANDGRSRTLARTVREQNRPDLFPILADALEDAGCDHADLLHFCRHGHPESDGVWVLDVLLGKG